MPTASLRTIALALAMCLVALAGVGTFVYLRYYPGKPADEKKETRVTERELKGVRFKRPEHAADRGIVAAPAQPTTWQPKLYVDGRVVANPQATLEVRAPFAGILRVDAGDPVWGLGTRVAANRPLAGIEARFTATEKLDLKAKLVEAEARRKSADELLSLREARLKRLKNVSEGILPQDEYDVANAQIVDARMQRNIAHTQYLIWKKVLEFEGETSTLVPLTTPIGGEITEIGAQPGANVEAGQMLARIVDFSRVLLRLDFPLDAGRPKPRVQVEALGNYLETSRPWSASRRGPASSLEIGLQKASYFYEILPDSKGDSPCWQPGLFVKAVLDDPTRAGQPAVAIPESALLLHQGRTLVYIELRLGRYERREVDVLGREGDMLYVAAYGNFRGLRGSEAVVFRNAQVLLSEEFRSEMDDD